MYSTDQLVLKYAQQFLVFAAIFQLSDSIQAPVQGALRGYKDVTITFIMAIISYWIIGLPTGYLLANYTDFGPVGYWLGLVAGLSAGAITLLIRLLLVQKDSFYDKYNAKMLNMNIFALFSYQRLKSLLSENPCTNNRNFHFRF